MLREDSWARWQRRNESRRPCTSLKIGQIRSEGSGGGHVRLALVWGDGQIEVQQVVDVRKISLHRAWQLELVQIYVRRRSAESRHTVPTAD